METKEQVAITERTLKAMPVITLLAGAPPFFIYGWARLMGSLPSEHVWETRGGNHGPWWGQWQELSLALSLLAMMALPFVTLLLAALRVRWDEKRLLRFSQGVSLALLQIFCAHLMMAVLFWTID